MDETETSANLRRRKSLPKPFQKMRKGLGKEVQLRSHCLSLPYLRFMVEHFCGLRSFSSRVIYRNWISQLYAAQIL
jgi:hypothetical protein